MTYRGRIKTRVIVFDEPMALPERVEAFVGRVRGMLHRRTADQSVSTLTALRPRPSLKRIADLVGESFETRSLVLVDRTS